MFSCTFIFVKPVVILRLDKKFIITVSGRGTYGDGDLRQKNVRAKEIWDGYYRKRHIRGGLRQEKLLKCVCLGQYT